MDVVMVLVLLGWIGLGMFTMLRLARYHGAYSDELTILVVLIYVGVPLLAVTVGGLR